MHIFVKTLTSKTVTLKVKTRDARKTIKAKAQGKEAIPPDRQHLISAGNQQQDGQAIPCNNIQEESTWHLELCLREGIIDPSQHQLDQKDNCNKMIKC
ncbi:ubiquitin-like [Suricata suricatta]|uniref:ubiquitin-like n=1 Tax=Suricata suricatta TaxID=37032 RepID=UPI0011555C57|nr:ubiquitin-like [Suricata suricatta]